MRFHEAISKPSTAPGRGDFNQSSLPSDSDSEAVDNKSSILNTVSSPGMACVRNVEARRP